VLYVATKGADGKWTMQPLELADHPDGSVGYFVTAMGQDADGELYVMTNTSNMVKGNTGRVWKLAAQ